MFYHIFDEMLCIGGGYASDGRRRCAFDFQSKNDIGEKRVCRDFSREVLISRKFKLKSRERFGWWSL